MSHPNPSTALGSVVIDELAALGIRRIVISPGSRSGPLSIAASQHPEIETRMCIDERSAAFVALGIAKSSGEPAAVMCTSGTAAANFLPAVIEADMSAAPIVVVTADRPAAMHGIGANQTIQQAGMFDSWARGSSSIPAPTAEHDGNREWRAAVRRVVTAAIGPHPGPGHLNVELSEPLAPASNDGRVVADPYEHPTARIEAGVATKANESSAELPRLESGRGLVIAGDGDYDREGLLAVAEALRWPVLATALSRLRGSSAIAAYADIIGDDLPEELVPEIAIAVGAVGPDMRLEYLIADADRRVRIDRWGRINDPLSNATDVLTGDALELLEKASGSPSKAFQELWRNAEKRAVGEREDEPASLDGLGVVGVINELDWDTLFVGSSLPIREVDRRLDRAGRVVANRGASGIDGSVSTALGAAWASTGRTIAYLGDLAMIHDGNGLLLESRDLDLLIVVADNNGGRIFEDLPHARFAPDFERLFVTPHARDLGDLAAFHGVPYSSVGDRRELVAAAKEGLEEGGVRVVRVDLSRSPSD